MKSTKEYREQAASLLDRVTAIAALPDAETTAEHKAEALRIMGKGKPGDADYAAGELASVEAALATAEKIEAKSAEYAAARVNNATPVQASAPNVEAKSTVYATARRTGNFRCFKGPDAEANAYAAGQFYRAICWQDMKAKRWLADHGIRAAMSESSNESGGVLVPTIVESSVIRLVEEAGIARGACRVYPMGSDTLVLPRQINGVTATFTPGENGLMTASQLTLDGPTLVAQRLYSFDAYSRELASDAVAQIGDLISTDMAYRFVVKEDHCLFAGTGSAADGKITGIPAALNAVANTPSVVTAASATSFGALTFADYEAVTAKLARYPGIKPRWYVSQVGFEQSMCHLMDAAGGNRITDLANGARELMFMGRPVTIVQTMNSVSGTDASQPKVIYGDLSMGVAFGDRAGVEIDTSAHYLFANNQIAVRGIERFDIVVHSRADANSASGAGAIVVLQTHA